METLKKAQQFIEFSSLSLEDKQDFVPFIIVTDEENREFFVGFGQMPTEPEGKDQLADIIVALCVVYGAVEVAFGSAAWAAETTVDDDSNVPPSERPNRQEVATVAAANAAGIEHVYVASVLRESGKVGIGLWERFPLAAMPGRIAEALHMGIKLSAKMPPDIRAYMREQMEGGLAQEIIMSTASVISKTRHSWMKLEEGMWEK